MDFAPGVGYCVIPSDRWIVSPAAGTVSNVSCGGCQIKINHQDGWGSYFYHVANLRTNILATRPQNLVVVEIVVAVQDMPQGLTSTMV